jgi:hypothetical protein
VNEVPPYPDHDCPACERGERTVTPPHSSVVGSMPVHQPSGNVCVKWLAPEILDILRKNQQQGNGVLWADSSGHVWDRVEGVSCVQCPHCLFTFDSIHTDGKGGYSCPNCTGCPETGEGARDRGLILELGAFGMGKAAAFRWVMMKIGETFGSTPAMFILAAAIAAGANEKLEIHIAKVLRIMRELADQYGVDMRDVDIVPTSDQQ